jgi:hypothetical protein
MEHADDLILLAPNRQVLQQMVSVCEKITTSLSRYSGFLRSQTVGKDGER